MFYEFSTISHDESGKRDLLMFDLMKQIWLFDTKAHFFSLQEVDFFRDVDLLVELWLQDVCFF